MSGSANLKKGLASYNGQTIAASLNECHSSYEICSAPFIGAAYDCSSSSGRSFGGTGVSIGTLVRVHMYDRDQELGFFAGIMHDCVVEVTTAGKPGISLYNNLLGLADETDIGGSTTTAVVDGDVTAAFLTGAYLYQSDDDSFHRITAVVYSSPNTTITVTPAASTSFAGKTNIRAWIPTKITNSTIITVDSAAMTGFYGFMNCPMLMSQCRMNIAEDALATNMLATPHNVIDANLISALKDF